jgi:hypothetical protein
LTTIGHVNLEAALSELFGDQASGLAIVFDAQDLPVGMCHMGRLGGMASPHDSKSHHR